MYVYVLTFYRFTKEPNLFYTQKFYTDQPQVVKGLLICAVEVMKSADSFYKK